MWSLQQSEKSKVTNLIDIRRYHFFTIPQKEINYFSYSTNLN